MSINNYYIFRSGELLLTGKHTLPTELPADLSGCITDSIELLLSGVPSLAVLLSETRTVQAVVSASVSDGAIVPDSLPDAATMFTAKSADRWIKLRTLLASEELPLSDIARSATRALGLLNWHTSHRFCSRCGGSYVDHTKEIARVCAACSSTVYPRLSPAIIVLVKKEGKILLARHAGRNIDVFSCIAGYVEHGESLEECVVREVAEETGIQVGNVRYAGSQSWPYPDQYMIAFYADWKSGEICIDPSEILEAQWFDPDNLPNHPMAGTVAWRLINGF